MKRIKTFNELFESTDFEEFGLEFEELNLEDVVPESKIIDEFEVNGLDVEETRYDTPGNEITVSFSYDELPDDIDNVLDNICKEIGAVEFELGKSGYIVSFSFTIK